MKILVCISNVPDTTTKITFTPDHTSFNTAGVQFILNPYDELALARAIELCEGGKGSVTVIHVGEASADPTLRKALAIGADDAVRIDAVAADAGFTAFQVAGYARDKGFDLLLTGRESIDYNGAQVAPMLGEYLGIPSVSMIKKLALQDQGAVVDREIEGGKEAIRLDFPFVASCAEGVAEPKIPNMRGIMSARTKPLAVVAAQPFLATTRYALFETPSPRRAVKLIPASETGTLVDLLHREAKVI